MTGADYFGKQTIQAVQYEGQPSQLADGSTVVVSRRVEVDWLSSLLLSLVVSVLLTYLVNFWRR